MSMVIGIGIGVAVTLLAMLLFSLPRGSSFENGESSIQETHPTIEIQMNKTAYVIGERLDFTVHTYGICASPNVSILREDAGQLIVVYQYVASPISCPPPNNPNEPHLRWQADQLHQEFSDEFFGGNGASMITTNAALTLYNPGNYTVSASLIDESTATSKDFRVTEENTGEATDATTPPIHLELTSLKAYTTNQELIGDVTPNMEFKKGQQVLFNATLSNKSPATEMRASTDYVLILGIKDQGESPMPDDFTIVTGSNLIIPSGGSVSASNSWLPEQVGNYTVVVFSLRKTDLNSTMIMSPLAAIPIRVAE